MGTLISTDIPIVQHLTDHGDVPVVHTGCAVYSIDSAGKRWVRKREANTGIEELLAEMIGWLLARKLFVPVPEAGVFVAGNDRSWLSAEIQDVLHWDSSRAPFVTNMAGLGAMMALDTMILNEDRHAGNILLQPDLDQLHLKAWAIDHGNALVGWPTDYVARRREIPDPRNLAPGLPMDLVQEGAMEAAEKATCIVSQDILALVREACTNAAEPKIDETVSVLAERCANARPLVESYLKRIRGGRP
jgi:hypothetical protein